MLQYWLKDQLQQEMPGVQITVDYEAATNEFITVFAEGGGQPGAYDLQDRHPNYMVWIESDDFGFAEYLAERVYETLHNRHKRFGSVEVDIDYYKGQTLLKTTHVTLQKLIAQGDVNRIGVEDNKMQYSVNFTATILPKGETIHE